MSHIIHLDEELKRLKEDTLDMAKLAQKQFHKSIAALLEFDKDLALEVRFNEKRVNAMELNIDKKCENILALLNPVAIDLRFVFSTLKINANLERLGDNAEGIARYVQDSKNKIDLELIRVTHFEEMHDIAGKMIEDVIEAFITDNPKLARKVFQRDDRMDEINREATAIVSEYIKSNLDRTQEALILLTLVRKLERVGDLIVNVAEEVIFYVEAKVLKHGKKKSE
jgi:phosphate transport system protein